MKATNVVVTDDFKEKVVHQCAKHIITCADMLMNCRHITVAGSMPFD